MILYAYHAESRNEGTALEVPDGIFNESESVTLLEAVNVLRDNDVEPTFLGPWFECRQCVENQVPEPRVLEWQANYARASSENGNLYCHACAAEIKRVTFLGKEARLFQSKAKERAALKPDDNGFKAALELLEETKRHNQRA